jgi:hypothetical protein
VSGLGKGSRFQGSNIGTIYPIILALAARRESTLLGNLRIHDRHPERFYYNEFLC